MSSSLEGEVAIIALITSTEMFRKAYEGDYATSAFNVNNMEIVQDITGATVELRLLVILQASAGTRKYTNSIYLVKFVETTVELHPEVPIVLHLDHGADFATYKDCIDDGFTSAMIDYSGHDFEEDIAETGEIVEYAYAHDVVVETEPGTLADVEDDVRIREGMSSYTKPGEVEEFVSHAGCDSLAIAIGTNHGAYKFKPGTEPQLRLGILEEVKKRLSGFPIVLHGASSVPQECMKIIDANGGQLKDAIGVPEDQPHEAAGNTVCRTNIDPDLRLGMTAGIRQHFNEHLDHLDPRQYLGDGGANVKAIVACKITGVLGSNNRT